MEILIKLSGSVRYFCLLAGDAVPVLALLLVLLACLPPAVPECLHTHLPVWCPALPIYTCTLPCAWGLLPQLWLLPDHPWTLLGTVAFPLDGLTQEVWVSPGFLLLAFLMQCCAVSLQRSLQQVPGL